MAEGKIGFAFPFFSRVHPVPARSLRLVYKSVSQGEREETSGLSDRSGSGCIRMEEKPEVLQLPRGKWRGKRIEVLVGSMTLFKD